MNAHPILPEGADTVLDGSAGGYSDTDYVDALRNWAPVDDYWPGPDGLDEAIEDANDWLAGTNMAIGWHPYYPGCLMIGTLEWWQSIDE